MDVFAVSDGAAALMLPSIAYASRIGKASAPRVAAISTVTPSFASALVEMPDIATDSAVAVPAQSFRAALPKKAYEEAGIGTEDVSVAEVFDVSTAPVRDWIEELGSILWKESWCSYVYILLGVDLYHKKKSLKI